MKSRSFGPSLVREGLWSGQAFAAALVTWSHNLQLNQSLNLKHSYYSLSDQAFNSIIMIKTKWIHLDSEVLAKFHTNYFSGLMMLCERESFLYWDSDFTKQAITMTV